MSNDVRRFLQESLGRPPEEKIVRYLEKRGKTEPIHRGRKGEEKLTQEYLALEREFGGLEEPSVIEIPGDARCEALSRILSIEAERRDDVAQFRKKHMRGRLIKPESVHSWVQTRGDVSLRGSKSRDGTRVKERSSSVSTSYQPQRLYYFDPTTDSVRSAALRPGGPLSELKAIVTSLCAIHNVWTEPHVATFVLTGNPPPVPLIRIEFEKNATWPAESRAHIITDAATITQLPVDVLTEVRNALMPGNQRRMKGLSAKHLELAVWGEKRRGEPDTPWPVLLHEFNGKFPSWAYEGKTSEVHFSRDVRSAWCRVTGKIWT